MTALIKWAATFVAALIGEWINRLKRDNDLREEGRTEVVKEANDAADQRKKTADDVGANWDKLSPDERERVRNEHGHYRD